MKLIEVQKKVRYKKNPELLPDVLKLPSGMNNQILHEEDTIAEARRVRNIYEERQGGHLFFQQRYKRLNSQQYPKSVFWMVACYRLSD